MGFSNGTPTITTDGLVFAVDAGNGQSYVSGSSDTFSLVSSNTGSIHNDVDFDLPNGGSWGFDGVDDIILIKYGVSGRTGYNAPLIGNGSSFSGVRMF